MGLAAGRAGGLGFGWPGAPGSSASPASTAGPVPTRRDIFRVDLIWFVIWGLCRGAGGGPGGGAGVRLARGSRLLRIPRVHRRCSPNSARHLSGRFELVCDLGTVSWGWRHGGRGGLILSSDALRRPSSYIELRLFSKICSLVTYFYVLLRDKYSS